MCQEARLGTDDACGSAMSGTSPKKVVTNTQAGCVKSRKLKNALAPDWVREVLTSAIAARKSKLQTVVVDLFAGWQSLAPICEEFGLNYVGVDIEGNRNLAKGS